MGRRTVPATNAGTTWGRGDHEFQIARCEWWRLRRRAACAALLSLLTLPHSGFAQVVGRKARIGFLIEPPIDSSLQKAVLDPFRQELRQLGYVEGQNVVLDVRSAEGKFDRLPRSW